MNELIILLILKHILVKTPVKEYYQYDKIVMEFCSLIFCSLDKIYGDGLIYYVDHFNELSLC